MYPPHCFEPQVAWEAEYLASRPTKVYARYHLQNQHPRQTFPPSRQINTPKANNTIYRICLDYRETQDIRYHQDLTAFAMEHHSILAYRLRRDRVQTYLRDKFNDQHIEVTISGNEFVFYLVRRLTEDEEEDIDELRE